MNEIMKYKICRPYNVLTARRFLVFPDSACSQVQITANEEVAYRPTWHCVLCARLCWLGFYCDYCR